MKYAINGKFLSQNITGVQRYAKEITKSLDKIIDKDEFCIICAKDAKDIPEYRNIKLIRLGNKANLFWSEIIFPLYCLFYNLLSINLCNTCSFINPGIVCIHDICFKHYPHFFTKKYYLWSLIKTSYTVKYAKGLITVSNFSKKDIEVNYSNIKDKIVVIPNAYQHLLDIDFDDSVFEKFDIKKNDYYFSLASLSPNKNIKWIIETAKLNPNEKFVIAGKKDIKIFGKTDDSYYDNLIFTGYVSDLEAKSLYRYSKAFIFPSFFEGFGIPPMEALACGCDKIIVSDTDCMHEIYEDEASYIDPNKACVNLSNILKKANSNKILNKYSWDKSAILLKNHLDNLK